MLAFCSLSKSIKTTLVNKTEMRDVSKVLICANSITDHKLVWNEETSVLTNKVVLEVVWVLLVESDSIAYLLWRECHNFLVD